MKLRAATPSRRSTLRLACGGQGGFTLVELMIVLVIIGLLAAITLPAMKNIRQNNTMVSAGRQLVDDLSLARARAISDRTTVHVIFVPPTVAGMTFNNADSRDVKTGQRVQTGPYTTYAIFADRSAGDQPGRGQHRYLTSWRFLPDGILIATNKYLDSYGQPGWVTTDPLYRPFQFHPLRFPTSSGFEQRVPHITFGPNGAPVVRDSGGNIVIQDEVIPLARGSILVQRDENTGAVLEFDVRESPPGNAADTNSFHVVRIDGLTGRARVETKAIY